MQSNLDELVRRGSATAKAGFSNEKDVVDKFNAWKTDADAQKWLLIMDYKLEEIEKIEALKVTGSYKADVQVKIKIYLKDAIAAENISIKLVSNPQGFNQIDKRWVDKYVDLWAMPVNITHTLKLFTGEIEPNIPNSRDPRRLFLDELPIQEQEDLVNFFNQNKIMIITDILKGRDKLAAAWMLIYQKDIGTWSLLPMSVVMNFYGNGEVAITVQGSLKIGEITMQRKGGDGGRKTAQMLQFKMNPCKIVNNKI
jgi:hypothetical protein